MKLKEEIIRIAKKAQDASRKMLSVSSAAKNAALKDAAAGILRNKDLILRANRLDVSKAKAAKMQASLIDRLTLNEKRICQMADSLVEVAKLKDPVGEVIKSWRAKSGLKINKVRVPIGVIAIIYESRPNVTADCAGLTLKSGNSVILRGGSEALRSNMAIFSVFNSALKKNKLPDGVINLITTTDRRAVDELLKLNDYIDLVMPRGGEGLIERVVSLSRIPVIKHYKGICHVYVDKYADLKMAEDICFNAKVQRPGVCNAMESMLVHKDIAKIFLPQMLNRFQRAGVQIRGCPITRKFGKGIRLATEKDYATEYLDLVLSVKVVRDAEEAIRHINTFGSRHSDSIVTANRRNASRFLNGVDSSCVYVNASTRFTDGYQFGMGAEIGISTDKIHARGPMALEELTTYKYMVFGKGQVRV